MPTFLAGFRPVQPRYVTAQEDSLRWLAAAQAQVNLSIPATSASPRDQEAHLSRYACSPTRIARRGHELEDFLHTDWERMRIFNLLRYPAGGAGMGERSRFFLERMEPIFDALFPAVPDVRAPNELMHVTCTGYNMPSGAQRLVNRRNWNEVTSVTHVYHMGCLAALPALRLASGSLARKPVRVAIAHTELCTLHLNPAHQSPKDCVAHSLFADGIIAYMALSEEKAAKAAGPALRLLGQLDRIVPNSTDAMTWMPEDWGMRMHLDRQIPMLIGKSLSRFLSDLLAVSGLEVTRERPRAVFAIHPGGPKILENARSILELETWQLEHSAQVLLEHGNMSSATLPHIWARLLSDPRLEDGTPVISLGFGPGLTLSGAVFRKETP